MAIYHRSPYARITQGVRFDGVDDYINCGDISAIDNAVQMTGSAWVYHNASAANEDIMNKNNGTSDGFLFYRNNINDKYSVLIRDSADTDTASASSDNATSLIAIWTHVAFTIELGSVTGLQVYVNGLPSGSAGDASSIGAINAFSAGFNISGVGTGNNPFNGRISDAAIWNKVLDASSIAQLYRRRQHGLPLTIFPFNLIGYWPLDDYASNVSGEGRIFYDYSGKRNHGSGIGCKSSGGINRPTNYINQYRRRHRYQNAAAAPAGAATGILTPRSGYWGDL